MALMKKKLINRNTQCASKQIGYIRSTLAAEPGGKGLISNPTDFFKEFSVYSLRWSFTRFNMTTKKPPLAWAQDFVDIIT